MTRFTLSHAAGGTTTFADDVRRGLTSMPKSIPPRHFYDALGSALFGAICNLPEYYVTRAEESVLQTHASDIVQTFGGPLRLVELGSGESRKTRLLIEAALARQRALDYLPIDIDASVLQLAAKHLLVEYPSLSIQATCCDFEHAADAIRSHPAPPGVRTIVLFLGSTIGNLDEVDAVSMLSSIRSALVPGDALFLGADLKKPRKVLEPAYDDALGVTAAFNLNLLARINRELGGNFRLDQFAHLAFYDEARGRIEMHLAARDAQTVRIDSLGMLVNFAHGETIHTENSYKYEPRDIETIASRSGFGIRKFWTDSQRWFADFLLVPR
jgi:dimethylhistidine N-methyltransferase